MIDVYAIGLKNLFELVDKGLSGSFNSQQLKDLVDIVWNSPFTINIRMTETSFKVSPFSLKHDLFFPLTASC